MWPSSPDLYIWIAIFWFFFFFFFLSSHSNSSGLLGYYSLTCEWYLIQSLQIAFVSNIAAIQNLEGGGGRKRLRLWILCGRFFVQFWAVESACSTMSVLHCPLLVCLTTAYIWSTPWPHFLFLSPHTLTDQHYHTSIQRENRGQTA